MVLTFCERARIIHLVAEGNDETAKRQTPKRGGGGIGIRARLRGV